MEFTKAHLRRAHLLAPVVAHLARGPERRPRRFLRREQRGPSLPSRRHGRDNRRLCLGHERRQGFAGDLDRHGDVGIRIGIQRSSCPLHRRQAPPELV
ncbi:MAG: hypothetical protein M3R02_12195 [Chloroflexota bacterium]|nr:hypothetical protein [Chloroflexota bacterium]